MADSGRMSWDPTKVQFLDIGDREIDQSAVDSIRETMHQLITEAELMLIWFAGLSRSFAAIRLDLKSLEHLLEHPPLTLVIEDPEDYEGDRIRAMDLFVPKERVLEAFSSGGDFEQLFGKAFVTFVFHMWDEFSRPAIARSLGVQPVQHVKADLMGDWRCLRNWLVHQHQSSEDNFFGKAKILSGAFDLHRGQPIISAKVIVGLVARLNVMQVRLDNS